MLFRSPGATHPSVDMAAEQREFEDRRRELEELLPRARYLCFRYGRPDVFAGLPYVTLGHYSPQQRTDSAIGRGERGALMACLIELSAACREPECGPEAAIEPPVTKPSLRKRIVGFFW